VERSSDDLDSDGVVDDLAGEPAADALHVFGVLDIHEVKRPCLAQVGKESRELRGVVATA
jgi:hypothetical protein